jgi:phosphate starvation-inducible PhoH-like protein
MAEMVVDNTIDFRNYGSTRRVPQLIPKSLSQEHYIELLQDPTVNVVLAAGPAGTGKTMMAVIAAVQAFRSGQVERLVITRPAVGVDGEKHGFLPGDLNSKMEPWTRPIFDVLHEYYSTKDTARMLEEQTIEISPLAFLRGRTFKRSWIIFDEAQNSTENQMKMVLTRLGEDSKMVITGDLAQHDRKFVEENGFRDFIQRLKTQGSSMISLVEFNSRDIQRHPVVKEVLKLYGEY